MNARFAVAVAGVSGLAALAVALLSAGWNSDSAIWGATGAILGLLAVICFAVLGRAVVISERRGRQR